MNIILWIVQGLIAAMFAMAGFMKISKSKDDLNKQSGMSWVESVSAGNIKIIGVLELLAAVGLVVPLAMGTLPWLTPLAASGLVLIMFGAMTLHAKRGDGIKAIAGNVVLLLLAGSVAIGRFMILPVS